MINMSDEEFKLLSFYIKENSGINLRKEKKALLVGRLNNMLLELGMDNFMDYYKYLQNNTQGEELSKLIDKVTTNHTFFMREAEHFNYFTETVLPYFRKTIKDRDFRIWCAASSSGEEPYTLAILLDEFFKPTGEIWDKKLLATDLSLKALEDAKRGIYNYEHISSLPKLWVLNYFDKISQTEYQVKNEMRKEVIYRRFNLLESVFPFKKKFHVIFCRNVMIYFDNPTKEALLNKLYDSLDYGGYLFIGHSESINREKTRFKYIKPAVYRKI
ncbi:CheR-type MCP methyltransferase [Lachnotalea glycerini]|uniref:protein-glutamate O-methyltransferase n=1 Tax=Lachnotalea glycerini TaxID=1763509 RepID=A0A255IIR1_9FIRM|nr:protein-glutamate O-methyltransferase CheR [Lachnotalea glycerini]PXV95483.1 CheR-type MCP methyltransferase [Lachnotalea glycerini]RDY32803.1 protein-glutamate O-methyltransferase CheR [Lachnotalea glycerini]